MSKFDDERLILDLAKPTLEIIYGSFFIDDDQKDKPDAAIFLNGNENKRIGIEITSVDEAEYQKYFKDTKLGRKEEEEQYELSQRNPGFNHSALKKAPINFKKDFISKGVRSKLEKYNSYVNGGNFDEMIILAFSEYYDLKSERYHVDWADFLLSKIRFPFDKVLFVGSGYSDCVLVYDKSQPRLEMPKKDAEKEKGIIYSELGRVSMGKLNIKNFLDPESEALVPMDKKKRKKKKEIKK